MADVFIELTAIITIAVFFAGIARMLKQPLIISYIATGIVVGLLGFTLSEAMDTFAHLGIALLLFMVGIHLNPRIIKEVGKISLITGVGQVLFTTTIGFVISLLLGFSWLNALYIGIALAFSSTIIIMKLLADKGDLDTLYGRIAMGFLLVQDFIVVLALMFIAALTSGGSLSTILINSLGGFGLLLVSVYFFSLKLLPRILKSMASSQELLLLFAIAWCFVISAICYAIGFSVEVGALIAGVTLAMSPYRYEVAAKLKPLRDFFLVIFFIVLGSQMVFGDITMHLVPILILSALILIGNPLIVLFLICRMGYTKRTAFLAGLAVAQISEFSLILVAMGVRVGHIPADILSLITVVALITISGSTYLILYANRVYDWISPYIRVFEKHGKKVDEHKKHKHTNYDIILFGYNRTGYDIMKALKKTRKRVLVVDYSPDRIEELSRKKFHYRYGDASDSELLSELPFDKASMVITTVTDIDTNMLLTTHLRKKNKKAILIAMSHDTDAAMQLYEQGATYVMIPHFLGGHHASTLIEENKLDLKKFIKHKTKHIKYLRERIKQSGKKH